MKISAARIALFAAIALMGTGMQTAQSADTSTFPTHAVRFIIPSSPGGGTDFVARALAERLSKLWKQPVVPENHGGAGGSIGLELVTRAKPDGYTLAAFNVGQLVAAQLLTKTISFQNFTAVARTALGPQILVINPDVSARTVGDLVKLAKASPGSLNYGSTGVGGTTHLAMEAFLHDAGIQMHHVPYQGTAPVLPDLLAGRIQAAMASPPSVQQFVKLGKLRALAITGATHSSELPDVPTFAEAGYPDYDMSTWFGVFGPAGMSPDMVAKLNADLTTATQDDDLKKQLAAMGIEIAGGLTSQQLTDYMSKEAVKWNDAAKAAGME